MLELESLAVLSLCQKNYKSLLFNTILIREGRNYTSKTTIFIFLLSFIKKINNAFFLVEMEPPYLIGI